MTKSAVDPFASIGDEVAPDVQARFSAGKDGHVPSKDERIIIIPKDEIEPDPNNPRRPDDPSMALGELDNIRASIENAGQQIPIIVGPRGANGKYRLIAGHRRLAAIMRSDKVHTCKAILRETIPGGERGVLEIQLLENAHRPDVSVISDAEAVRKLVELYDGDRATVQGILGISREMLSYKLSVANASDQVKDFARRSHQDDLQGLYELVKLDGENPEVAQQYMRERLANKSTAGIRGDVKQLRAKMKASSADAAKGDGTDGGKGGVMVVGTRGKAPLAQKVAIDVSKGYPVLLVESKGVLNRYRLDEAGVAAIRDGIATVGASVQGEGAAA